MNNANIALSIYSSGEFRTSGQGTSEVGWATDNHTWTWEPWTEVYPRYQYFWCGSGYRTSKIEKAFKIVQMLMDKKIVKITSVKKFVDLVNEVSEVL